MAQQQTPAELPPFGEIRAAVDSVVTTHGAYIPVELLLTMGQLRYTDYEAWRRGGQSSLQSVLACEARQTVDLLKEAARWARALGLEPDVQAYFGWGGLARQRLVFFNDGPHEADTLLATHYVRPGELAAGDQLDLFLDSGATVALQDLRAALRARDTEVAEQRLATLDANAPGHPLRPAARRLIDALASVAEPVSQKHAAAELAAIEQDLLPAARDLLGSQARDLMAFFWRRLAAALPEAVFVPDRPALHASYAYIRCLDWRRAIAAIETVPDYASHPRLVARLARARYHEGDHHAAIAAWCALCWLCASTAEAALDDLPQGAARLREAWAGFRDLDLDPAPETALFPARLLLAEPGLARALPSGLAAGGSTPEQAFRAVRQLLVEDCIETRAAVRDAAPWLLVEYLGLRASS